jgi:hypothetical protein
VAFMCIAARRRGRRGVARKALSAKTPEDTNRAVQELRTELDEQPFVERRLVEVQINNLACLDRAVRTTSAAHPPL